MSEGRTGSSFTQRIAAAWLDAVEFADERAEQARPDKDECSHWERVADRHEAQSRLCLALANQRPEEEPAPAPA